MRKLLVIGKEERVVTNSPDKSELEKYDITCFPMGTPESEIIKRCGDTEYIIVDAMGSVSREMILNMPKLKIIHSEGVGFQGVDVKTAASKGVYVCNCKGMNATAVAEHAILLMLGVLRNVIGCDKAVRAGKQITVKENFMLTGSLKELRECTVGLIGFGDIAKAAAKLLNAFGSRILYYDVVRAPEAVEKELHASNVGLDELLEKSDIVSLHLPVFESTRHIANREFFSKMKKSSYLINTARGELVDSEALIDAISDGTISGAGLDTVEGEPVRMDNKLLKAPKHVLNKIIFSCHIGGITGASFSRGYGMVWADFEKVANGERPGHVVNKI